jgi:hypothetical protein
MESNDCYTRRLCKTKGDMSIRRNPQCNNFKSDRRLNKLDTAPTGGDRPPHLTSTNYMKGNLNAWHQQSLPPSLSLNVRKNIK